MDSLIRFCFLIDPDKIESMDEYAKLFNQAKWVSDYTGLMHAKKAIQGLAQ